MLLRGSIFSFCDSKESKETKVAAPPLSSYSLSSFMLHVKDVVLLMEQDKRSFREVLSRKGPFSDNTIHCGNDSAAPRDG